MLAPGELRRPEKRIQATNLSGLVIYTKGKFQREDGQETYYVLISSKRSI